MAGEIKVGKRDGFIHIKEDGTMDFYVPKECDDENACVIQMIDLFEKLISSQDAMHYVLNAKGKDEAPEIVWQ